MRVSPHELTLPHYNAAVRMSDRSRETQRSVQKTAIGRFGPVATMPRLRIQQAPTSTPTGIGRAIAFGNLSVERVNIVGTVLLSRRVRGQVSMIFTLDAT